MIELIHSFAAGLCFAFGAVVGVAIAGFTFKSRENNQLERISSTNKKIEDRLTRQVVALESLAFAATSRNTAPDSASERAK